MDERERGVYAKSLVCMYTLTASVHRILAITRSSLRDMSNSQEPVVDQGMLSVIKKHLGSLVTFGLARVVNIQPAQATVHTRYFKGR